MLGWISISPPDPLPRRLGSGAGESERRLVRAHAGSAPRVVALRPARLLAAAVATLAAAGLRSRGRRRLSFEIKKNAEGIYAVINVTCPSAVVSELDRQLNLNESVLRTKIIRPDAK